jgi:ferredoxin
MNTQLYVYTGTGNSLWVARQLAKELKDASLEFMSGSPRNLVAEVDQVGLIFPVHIWGLPHHVIRFVNHLQSRPETYVFAVAVNAGQVAATLLQLKKLMINQGWLLATGYSVVMPTNYIPWGGPGPLETQQQLFEGAQVKVKKIADSVLRGERREVERGPFWQNVLFPWFYKMSFRQVPRMDKNFWADDKCNGCEICSKICPVHNIEMLKGKPTWLHQCEQCFACLQWCPQEAIQYGKKTPKYQRYHHPEITLKDLLNQAKAIVVH